MNQLQFGKLLATKCCQSKVACAWVLSSVGGESRELSRLLSALRFSEMGMKRLDSEMNSLFFSDLVKLLEIKLTCKEVLLSSIYF